MADTLAPALTPEQLEAALALKPRRDVRRPVTYNGETFEILIATMPAVWWLRRIDRYVGFSKPGEPVYLIDRREDIVYLPDGSLADDEQREHALVIAALHSAAASARMNYAGNDIESAAVHERMTSDPGGHVVRGHWFPDGQGPELEDLSPTRRR